MGQSEMSQQYRFSPPAANEKPQLDNFNDYERIHGKYQSWELQHVALRGDVVTQEGDFADGTRAFVVYRPRDRSAQAQTGARVVIFFEAERIAIRARVAPIDVRDPDLYALVLDGDASDDERKRIREIVSKQPALFDGDVAPREALHDDELAASAADAVASADMAANADAVSTRVAGESASSEARTEVNATITVKATPTA